MTGRMGEKFVEWSDNRYPDYALSIDTILAQVSFYWYTNSFGRSLWAYRSLTAEVGAPLPLMPFSTTKPFGYSWFPHEILSLPQAWGEFLFPNMVFHRRHERVSPFFLFLLGEWSTWILVVVVSWLTVISEQIGRSFCCITGAGGFSGGCRGVRGVGQDYSVVLERFQSLCAWGLVPGLLENRTSNLNSKMVSGEIGHNRVDINGE